MGLQEENYGDMNYFIAWAVLKAYNILKGDKMNAKQKAFLWLGIIAFVLMGIFPPWFYPINIEGLKSRTNVDYKSILSPPEAIGENKYEGLIGASIDFSRLAVQWVMVAVITGGFVVSLKNSRKP